MAYRLQNIGSVVALEIRHFFLLMVCFFLVMSSRVLLANNCEEYFELQISRPETFPVLFEINIDAPTLDKLKSVRRNQMLGNLEKVRRLNHFFSPGESVEIKGKKWRIKGLVDLSQNTNTYIVEHRGDVRILAQDGDIGVSGFKPDSIQMGQYLRIIERLPTPSEVVLNETDLSRNRLRLPGEKIPGISGTVVEILGYGIEGIVYVLRDDSDELFTIKKFFTEGGAKSWVSSFESHSKYRKYRLPFLLIEEHNAVFIQNIYGVSVESIFSSDDPTLKSLMGEIDDSIEQMHPLISKSWIQQAVLDLESGSVYLVDHR